MKPIHLRQVAFAGLLSLVIVFVPRECQDQIARREYDQRYGKKLPLPDIVSRPFAERRRMPGIIGEALLVKVYQPDVREDAKLRAWLVANGGFDKFEIVRRGLPEPLGEWEAKRGKKVLIMSRYDQSGWLSLCLAVRMSPQEAQKDMEAFPW